MRDVASQPVRLLSALGVPLHDVQQEAEAAHLARFDGGARDA